MQELEAARRRTVVGEASGEERQAFRNAKSHEKKGSASWLTDKKTARIHYARFRELMRELTALAPENLQYRTEYIVASVKYADTCWHLGDVDEAMNVYADARRRFTALSTYDKEWRTAAVALVAAHTVVGEDRIKKGKPKDAEKLYTFAFEIADSWVTRDRMAKQANVFLCVLNLKLADACILQEDYDGAETHLDAAKDIAKGEVDITGRIFWKRERVFEIVAESNEAIWLLRMSGEDSRNDRFARADAFQQLGFRALKQQDFCPAYVYLRKALELREADIQTADRNIAKLQMLAHEKLALATKELKRIDEACGYYTKAIRMADNLIGSKPGDVNLTSYAAQARVELGKLEEARGNPAVAQTLYQEAMPPLEKLEESGMLDSKGLRVLIELQNRQK